MLNLLERTMTYPGFEPGTFGLAVSIANHYTIVIVFEMTKSYFLFLFKKFLYVFNYLSVCLFIYIYICNMFASRAKTKQHFKNLKTQNTL
jgi:hypothetical protein